MTKKLLYPLILIGLMASPLACKIHQVEVQQGNILTKEMLDKLHVGMTKKQVLFVLGTPLASDPFDVNHWDYVYILRIPGKEAQQKHLVLVFENDKLKEFSGDYNDPASKS